MIDIDSLNFNSVETLPGFEARAAFTVNSASVFREDVDIVPTIVNDTLSYVPWGGDNPGDIGRDNKQKLRRWFSCKYFASVINIRESFADNLGKDVADSISNALTRDISRRFIK